MKPEGVRHADRTIRICGVGYVQSRGVRGGGDRQHGRGGRRPSARRSNGPRTSPASNVRASPSPPPSARWPATASRPRLARRQADRRRRPGRAPSAWRWPRSGCRTAGRSTSCRSPGRSTAQGGRARPARHVRQDRWASTCWSSRWPRRVFNTLGHCLELAHLELEGVVAAPFVSALAALEEDEMDLGCVCIDMGGGSTSAAVFRGGSLLHVETRAGRRRPCDPGHRPRPVDLHRRRRAAQDPARLGHRLGQRGPRDDRGPAARRRPRRRPGRRARARC